MFFLFQVLAHRGGHWTNLQKVCHSVWEESNRLIALHQTASQLQPPFLVTSQELHNTFTPLLILATDLIMDMLSRLGVSVKYAPIRLSMWHLFKTVNDTEALFVALTPFVDISSYGVCTTA